MIIMCSICSSAVCIWANPVEKKPRHMLVRYVLKHSSWFELAHIWSWVGYKLAMSLTWAGASCLGPAYDQLKPAHTQLIPAQISYHASKHNLASIWCFFNRIVCLTAGNRENKCGTFAGVGLQAEEAEWERVQVRSGACLNIIPSSVLLLSSGCGWGRGFFIKMSSSSSSSLSISKATRLGLRERSGLLKILNNHCE